jgi:hypothetical protein
MVAKAMADAKAGIKKETQQAVQQVQAAEDTAVKKEEEVAAKPEMLASSDSAASGASDSSGLSAAETVAQRGPMTGSLPSKQPAEAPAQSMVRSAPADAQPAMAAEEPKVEPVMAAEEPKVEPAVAAEEPKVEPAVAAEEPKVEPAEAKPVEPAMAAEEPKVEPAEVEPVEPAEAAEEPKVEPVEARPVEPEGQLEEMALEEFGLPEEDTCPSADIEIKEEMCGYDENRKRYLKTLLSPEANVKCPDSGSAAAEKLAKFLAMCEKSTVEASQPVGACPAMMVNIDGNTCSLSSEEIAALLEKLSPSANPGCIEEAAKKRAEYERACPVQAAPEQSTGEPTDTSGYPVLPSAGTHTPIVPTTKDEPDQPLPYLPPAGTHTPVVPVRKMERPTAPPVADDDEEEEEDEEDGDDDGDDGAADGDDDGDADGAAATVQSESTPVIGTPATPVIGQPVVGSSSSQSVDAPVTSEKQITTSTTVTPKPGYNEVQITIKVPSDFPQKATGTAGMTFASQMQEMTASKGGAKRHRAPITPRRKLYNGGKLMHKRTVRKYHMK